MNHGGRDHGHLADTPAASSAPATPDEQEIGLELDRLAVLAARLCGSDAALIAVLDAGRYRVIGEAGYPPAAGLRGDLPIDDPLLALLPRHSEGLDLFDPAAGPLLAGSAAAQRGGPFRAALAVPLDAAGRLPGVLCAFGLDGRAGPVPDEQRALLASVATAVAGLLEHRRHARAEACVAADAAAAAASSRETIAELEQRFAVLADAIPQLVWSARADGHSDYFNRMWCRFTGAPSAASEGAGWLDFLHPEDRERASEAWRTAVEQDCEYSIEYRLRRHDGVYRWVLARGQPLRDREGRVIRWLGTCTDVHETRAAAHHNELLSRELSHRIKNIFAVIGGLIGLTLREKPELALVGRELQDRVLALGRAHDFVRPQSAASARPLPHTSLFGMLEELFAAYQGANSPQRIHVSGDDISIDDRSATPLALAFHELATNAIKYGALSQAGGKVGLAVHQVGDHVEFDWREHGGPPVAAAPEPGFGASLVDLSLRLQLGGRVRHDWAPDGLRVLAAIPAAALSRG